MGELRIRAAGDKNGQVTAEVKAFLYRWLEAHGVTGARDRIVLHHYQNGDFVAVSDFGTGKRDRFEECRAILVDAHPQNRITSEKCVWVARVWLHDQMN
jgi:hypothetical protein